MLAELRRRDPSLRFEVVAGDVERVHRDHGVEAVSWTDWAAILDAVRRADLVLQGGGGLFFDYFPFDPAHLLAPEARELTHHASIAYVARLLGKPLMLYACGVGPLRTAASRRAVAGICEDADRITVRDEESMALLADIGVPHGRVAVTADPAFHVEFAGPPDVDGLFGERVGRQGRPLFVVCPRAWSIGADEDVWIPKMAAAVGAFVRAHDARLALVPFHAAVDDPIVDRLAAETGLGDAVRVLPGGLPYPQVAAWIRAADLVVGMRLHSIIFAAAATVPAVAVVYDPKVRNLARSLGVEDCAIDLEAIDALDDVLARTWEHRGEVVERLRRASDRLKSLAERNGDLAIELLASRAGTSTEPSVETPSGSAAGEGSRESAASPRILVIAPLPMARSAESALRARLEGLRDHGIAATTCFLKSSRGESPPPDFEVPARVCVVDHLPEILEAFEPDVIHLVDTTEPLAAIEQAQPGARVLLEVRTSDPRDFHPLLDSALGDRIDALIVPSESQRDAVAAVCPIPLPIFVVPDSVEQVFREAPAADLPLPPKPVVGWVGRWNDSSSSFMDFVEVAVMVAPHFPAEFWFVTDAVSARVERETLSQMVRRAGPEVRFRWFPSPGREELCAFYAAIARSGGCLVSTSRAESSGAFALEAMSQGCSAVLPDLPPFRDLIETGVNGWKYPAGDLESAARWVDVAVRNAPLRKAAGEAARQTALRLTPDRSAREMMKVLQTGRRPSGVPPRGEEPDPRIPALRQLLSTAIDRIRDLDRELASARDDLRVREKAQSDLERSLRDGSQYVRELAAERESTVRRLNAVTRRLEERIVELSRGVVDAPEDAGRSARS
jgi:polysaccharide pyruvyl transferase CsaB